MTRTIPGHIEHWIREARRNNWYPTAIAVYGAGNDLRFAGIWEANQTNVAWTEAGIADDFSIYQQRFDALVPAGGRPVQVAVSPDGRYASIFRDDQIGPWVARHGLTSAGYQQEFDRLVPQGFYPIDVHAGGQGTATRFAALFARQETIDPLVWHAPTGPTTVAAIDTLVQQAMQRHRIRGAGLALVRAGRLVYAKGYTLAEAGLSVDPADDLLPAGQLLEDDCCPGRVPPDPGRTADVRRRECRTSCTCSGPMEPHRPRVSDR